MLDPLKKTILASLGVVGFTKEKLDRLIQDLVDRGELTREQGQKVVEVLLAKGGAEGRNLADQICAEVERWLSQGPVATPTDLRAPEERLELPEHRLASGTASHAGGL